MAASRFIRLGDSALRAPLPEGASPRAVDDALRAVAGVVDVVVGARHVAVYFAGETPVGAMAALERALDLAWATRRVDGDGKLTRTHRVRVRYDGDDLADVAGRAGLCPDDVVALHTARPYVVDRIGFLPGFAYLAELDGRLVLPRRATPRARIAALSVGIAGRRTGIYPFASPGGWNLLGTAVDFAPFDAEHGAAFALGDRVVFEAVPP